MYQLRISLIECPAEVDTDSHAVVATCELLDILLDAETMTLDESGIRPLEKIARIYGDPVTPPASETGRSGVGKADTSPSDSILTSADPDNTEAVREQDANPQQVTEKGTSPARHCAHTGVPVQVAGRLVQHLVELLKQAERADALVCCIVCLSRLHALEGEPPSELVQCQPDEICASADVPPPGPPKPESTPAEAQHASAPGGGVKRLRGCCHLAATECGCSPTVSALWSVLRDTLAVRRLVSAAVTVINGGLTGPFWPHLAAALTVLTWVAAGLARPAGDLARAWDRARVAGRHSGGASAGEAGGGLPVKYQHMRWHSVCVHRAPFPGLTVSVHEWRASAAAFVAMVRRLCLLPGVALTRF